MSSAAARIRRIAIAIGASLVLAGCVLQPPQGDPTQSGPVQPDPTQSDPTQSDPSTGAPAEGQYRYDTETTGEDAWSFEPTGVEIIAEDALGNTAREGYQLVVLRIDAEMLQGEPDFYYQFRVAAFDEETSQYYGLSSGGTFLADDDLFSAGRQPSFEGAGAIYEVPVDWPIENWYFLHHSTGQQWFIVVPAT